MVSDRSVDSRSLARKPAAPRNKAARDPERSRAALLDAAMIEFVENGFGGARIDRIARRADVNKQLLYYYFGSKVDLYIAVLESAYSAIRSAEAQLHLTDLDPVKGIRELALFTWSYHVKHPDLISLVRTENLHKAMYLKRSARITGLNSPLIAAVSELLQRGAKSGQFRSDTDPVDVYITIAALCIYYLANHWTLETNFSRDLLAPERLTAWGEHLVEVILSYLRPLPFPATTIDSNSIAGDRPPLHLVTRNR